MSTITFTAGTTTTVTNFAVNGTAGNPVTINSSVPGTQFTLSQASGFVLANYISIQDSNAIGGATWIASNSTDLGDNLGWLFQLYKNFASSINSAGVMNVPSLYSQFDETQTLTYTPYVGTTAGSILLSTSTASANTPYVLNLNSTQDFTIECWVYFGSTSPNLIFGLNYKSGPTTIIVYQITNSGTQYRAQNQAALMGSTTINSNTWNHVALVRYSNVISYYVNGISIGTPLSDTASISNGYIILGDGSQALGTQYSDIRYVIGTAVYKSNFTTPTNKLTAIANTAVLYTANNITGYLYDSGPNNLTLTAPNGGVSFSANTPSLLAPQTTGTGSLLFANTATDGTVGNNFIQTANTTALALANTDFTIECWVYTNYLPTVNYGNWGLFDLQNTTGPLPYYGYGVFLNYTSGNYYLYVTQNPAGTSSSTMPSASIISTFLNKWVHTAYVRQNNYLQFFINGSPQLTPSTYSDSGSTYNAFNAAIMYVGGNNQSTAQFSWPGNITNFRFVNGTALYPALTYSSFTPPTAPLTKVDNTALLLSVNSSGTAFVDSSNNNLTLTAPNANVSFSTASPFASNNVVIPVAQRISPTAHQVSGYLDEVNLVTIPAVLPYSVAFDQYGSSGINFPVNSSLTLSGDFTIEAWVYQSNRNGKVLVGSNSNVLSAPNYQIQFNQGGTSGVTGLYDNGVAGWQTVTCSSSPLNTWFHLAYVRIGTTITIYFNGVSQGTFTNSASYDFSNGAIGNLYTYDNGGWQSGRISNFRIVKGLGVYTGNFTVPTTLLMATQGSGTNISAITNQTSVLTCQSNAFVDNSGNNLTLTAYADTTGTFANPLATVPTISNTGPISSAAVIPPARRLNSNGVLQVPGYFDEVTIA